MPSQVKGHNTSTPHGHGHSRGKELESTTRTLGNKVPVSSSNNKKKISTDRPIVSGERSTSGQVAVYATYNKKLYGELEDDTEEEQENETEKKEGESARMQEDKAAEKRNYIRANVTAENFNVQEFNTNMTEFIGTLEDPRYRQIDGDYPVQELVSLVNLITKSVNNYRLHSRDTHRQLQELTQAMQTIKENLHFSVTRQAMDLRTDDADETQEARDLKLQLTQFKAMMAQANVDVTEALRLAMETESTALKASIAAEEARQESRRIQEEAIKKEKAEQKRKEEDMKRLEEEKRQKELEEGRLREEKKLLEQEWKRHEALQCGQDGHVYETWQTAEYEFINEHGETEIVCIARGQPGSFHKDHVTCTLANDKEALVTYLPNEELISHVIDIRSTQGHKQLKEAIFVAVPHVLSRTSAQSREPVVKALVQGQWKELPTRDVTFESHKEIKFAQAEMCHLTTVVVMSRFKREYMTLSPHKSHKVTSSVDHRITFSFDKDTFGRAEHFWLQVQPVDSPTVQEFRTRQTHGKGLLTSSPIVYTQWQSTTLPIPVQVTITCPPNPAKAKKLALARKQKEERMKSPSKAPPVPLQQRDQQKEDIPEFTDKEKPALKVTKWYMGEYANTDDEETDKVCFVYMHAGKWFTEPDLKIKQVKMDVVSFQLELAVERFLVVRTRSTLDDKTVLSLVSAFSHFLGQRLVEAVVRQKIDNPFEVAVHVAPVSRCDAVLKQLAQKGFESGPSLSHVLCLQEGDIIQISFNGNLQCLHQLPDQLTYKSNLPTVTYLQVKEENQFLQKEQDVYSGLILLSRLYAVVPPKCKKVQVQGQSDEEEQQQQGVGKEWRSEKMCALQVNIPKYHIQPNTEPKKAPVIIPESAGPIDRELLMTLAESLGDEWKRVAYSLGVHRARVQAILRNVTVADRSEQEAKYDMLVTWLKGAAKALDKVSALSSALTQSDRNDLADFIRHRGREYKRGRMPLQQRAL